MNSITDKKILALVNPFDIKGGASLGTFRLFRHFQFYTDLSPCLFVIHQQSVDTPGLFGSNILIRLCFYVQAFFNRLLTRLLCRSGVPPQQFTFFSLLSLPAFSLFFKVTGFKHLYLHSMNAGFSCPLSFYLLASRSSIIKTADDWYLTGGCHYSLDCDQWRSGCRSCPHMNVMGKLIVRSNWLIKNFVLTRSSSLFVSPSNWLSNRYRYFFGARTKVVFNACNSPVLNDFLLTPACENSVTPQETVYSPPLVLGLPVTYLRDKRKGFIDCIPHLITILHAFPVRLCLCGGDASRFADMLTPEATNFHPLSSIISFGNLAAHEMSDFYTKLDFLLHMASYDNSPNVITEALGCSIPSIVLNDSGSPEHVMFSGAGYVIDSLDELYKIVEVICSDFSIVGSLKAKALVYAQKALSPSSMALSYSNLLN